MIRDLIQRLVYKTSTFIILIALILTGLSLNLAVGSADNLSASRTSSCNGSPDNVIYCGVPSIASLINKYDNGDSRNTASSIQSIYSYFHISSADIHAMNGSNGEETVTLGKVDKNGNVYGAGGKLVARDAITAGRQNIAGSTAKSASGTTFYVRKTSVSFASNSLDAYIIMLKGRFSFAVLVSCGNPVVATSVVEQTPKPVKVHKSVSTKTTSTGSTTIVNETCSNNINNIDEGGTCSSVSTTQPPPNNVTVSSTPTESSQTPASTLVNTGPGDIIGLFAVTTIAGFIVFRIFLSRKLNS